MPLTGRGLQLHLDRNLGGVETPPTSPFEPSWLLPILNPTMHAGVSSKHWSHCPAACTLGTQKTLGSQPSAALEHVNLHIPDHAGLFASISRSACWNFVLLTPPPATVQTYAGEPAMLVSAPCSI